MENFKVENIQKVNLNGYAMKLYDVRELVDGAWIFAGRFAAPAKIANKNLLQFYANNAV